MQGNMEVVSEMPPTAGELDDIVGDDERGVILPDEDDILLDEILCYEAFVWNLNK